MSRRDRDRVAKTNAMRELDRAGVAYEVRTYDYDEDDLSGVHAAEQLGEDPARVFKTLVTVSPSGSHVVCCIPVAEELDLKRAAVAAGEKSLSMLHVRDLEPTTGYLRGGCSPVGMRAAFPTIIDGTVVLHEKIAVSGGRRGLQLVVGPQALVDYLGAIVADICREGE